MKLVKDNQAESTRYIVVETTPSLLGRLLDSRKVLYLSFGLVLLIRLFTLQ